MDNLCPYCYSEVEDSENYPYCSRQCFDRDIDRALKQDASRCKFRTMLTSLRDDAEERVKRLEGQSKLVNVKAYFEARADILNDMLVVLEPENYPCNCCQ